MLTTVILSIELLIVELLLNNYTLMTHGLKLVIIPNSFICRKCFSPKRLVQSTSYGGNRLGEKANEHKWSPDTSYTRNKPLPPPLHLLIFTAIRLLIDRTRLIQLV